MTDEAKKEEKAPEADTNNQYIDTIKKLKENSVSKADYAKLQEENKRLLESVLNGEKVAQKEKENERSIDEIKKDLSKEGISNLEYVKTALELRKRVMEKGGDDPFLPTVKMKGTITQEDVDSASRVADVLEQCVQYANGDSALFTSELQRRTRDSNPIRR